MKNFKMAWPERSTPEDLEMDRRICMVINYGSHVIAITSNCGNSYHAAVYSRIDEFKPHESIYSCEDEIFMDREIAGLYPDEGHAIRAAMESIK